MTFQLKRFLFHFFSVLLLVGQISLSYWLFSMMHNSQQDRFDFLMNWFIPILLSTLAFIFLFMISIVVSGPKNIGFGSWFLTLPDIFMSKNSKDFRKVYHAELGYFILYIDDIKSKVSIFKQGIFKLKHLKEFNVEKPEILQVKIKNFLDKEYQDLLKSKEDEKIAKSKIEKIKEWDGFLDVVSKRDEKINQILK